MGDGVGKLAGAIKHGSRPEEALTAPLDPPILNGGWAHGTGCSPPVYPVPVSRVDDPHTRLRGCPLPEPCGSAPHPIDMRNLLWAIPRGSHAGTGKVMSARGPQPSHRPRTKA